MSHRTTDGVQTGTGTLPAVRHRTSVNTGQSVQLCAGLPHKPHGYCPLYTDGWPAVHRRTLYHSVHSWRSESIRT